MEFAIFFSGFCVGLLLYFMGTHKPRVPDLDPNTFEIPKALPMLDVKGIERGFGVDGNKVIQRWSYKGISQCRTITKDNGVITQKEFIEFWHRNELNFYLKNAEVFDKELNK